MIRLPTTCRDTARGNAGTYAAFCLIVLLAVSPGCRHPRDGAGCEPGVYHTVQRHQTFWRICKTYGVDMDEVARINGIKNKGRIETGQRIFIPRAKKVLQVDIYVEDVTAREKAAAIPFDKERFIWPVTGQVTEQFGTTTKRKHDGIDIAAPAGTPVLAADSGRVVYSDNKMRGYGNLIIIEHQDHCFTIYAHNEENVVKEEVLVKRGDIIARVGKTGNATGPHLHFEIRKGSIPLDPFQFLP